MSTYVQFIRCRDAEDLIKTDPYAFSILSMIAQRARRIDDPFTGLKTGEAMIGRSEFTKSRNGMSEKSFRSALKRLEKYGFAASKGTSKGTIVKLLNTTIYNINGNAEGPAEGPERGQQGANEGPTKGQQGATNKNVKNDKNEKMYNPDQIIPVISRSNQPTTETLGNILDWIFTKYPGNANTNDRGIVAEFLLENPTYPLAVAVNMEIWKCNQGSFPRNIQNFISNPPDTTKVISWYNKNKT